jgi:hypothetical protein
MGSRGITLQIVTIAAAGVIDHEPGTADVVSKVDEYVFTVRGQCIALANCFVRMRFRRRTVD